MANQASHPTDPADGANGTFAAVSETDQQEAPDAAAAAATEAPAAATEAPAAATEAPAAEQPVVAEEPSAADPTHDDLLGELARAMHLAATSQYERLNAELERRRAAQVEAIAARAGTEVEHLKTSSEKDISAIDAWSKAEIEKIKLERLRRIDARRERLAGQLERHETIKEREVFAIEAAADAHRNEIDLFFGRLERETDPAAIARVASTLPAFPPLDAIAEGARRGATAEFASLDAQAESATTASPPGRPETEAPASAETATAEAEPALIAAAAAPTDAEPVAASIGADPGISVSEARLMAVMDPDASRSDAETGRPWEAPYAVSVAAGTGPAEPPAEADTPSRVGSTLLRTVRAIRPMSGERHDRSGGGPKT
ncbi:MAG TPA: hypothetical protein VFW02_09960 [Candidatus Limnocylindrales bacterium]|nr:hypothetical protein [Candidatus Limnocylindrales bacterium]